MSQSKRHSLIEAIINILVGYGIAVTSQMYIFPVFDIYIPASEHLLIGLFFTLISLIRSYILRRIFNNLTVRKTNGNN